VGRHGTRSGASHHCRTARDLRLHRILETDRALAQRLTSSLPAGKQIRRTTAAHGETVRRLPTLSRKGVRDETFSDFPSYCAFARWNRYCALRLWLGLQRAPDCRVPRGKAPYTRSETNVPRSE